MVNIPYTIENKILIVSFQDEELFDRLVEPCREIFDQSFSSGVFNVILDFSAAQCMDSFFLAMLVLLYKEVNSHGGTVKLVGVGDRLGDILDRVRFRRLFQNFTTVQEAVASFNPVNSKTQD